jgi:hypothetical protein
VQLFDLVERTAAKLTTREANARFALYRLRAMRNVFENIPFGRGDTDPYKAWIASHHDAAQYNEPAGHWMIAPRYVLDVHGQYRDTTAADDIAWFFVQNGLAGECEGDLPCYAAGANKLSGEYLRLHPAGRHVEDALEDIVAGLNGAMDNVQQFPAVLAEFEPSLRCGELRAALDPLAAAVAATQSARQAAALATLARYRQLCQ